MPSVQQQMVEDGTGCRENAVDAQLYRDVHGKGIPITDAEALKLLCDEAVHDPNAGAGSYVRFAERMAFMQLKSFDRTSSAGDWTFIVSRGDNTWFVLFQENRYPYQGFRYSIDSRILEGTAEEVMAELAEDY